MYYTVYTIESNGVELSGVFNVCAPLAVEAGLKRRLAKSYAYKRITSICDKFGLCTKC